MMGTDATVGIYIIGFDGTETKLPADLIVANNPSEFILLLPADLAKDVYELRIVTQYSGTRKYLRTPRSVSQQLFVGVVPEQPIGDIIVPIG